MATSRILSRSSLALTIFSFNDPNWPFKSSFDFASLSFKAIKSELIFLSFSVFCSNDEFWADNSSLALFNFSCSFLKTSLFFLFSASNLAILSASPERALSSLSSSPKDKISSFKFLTSFTEVATGRPKTNRVPVSGAERGLPLTYKGFSVLKALVSALSFDR